MFAHDPDLELLTLVVDGVRELPPAADDAARIDRITRLEELKAAICAAQAEDAAALAATPAGRTPDQNAQQPAQTRSVGAQVGLARRESPWRGRALVDLGTALVHDLPHTMAALRGGLINERRAMIVARETNDLSHETRLVVDADLAGRLGTLGDRETQLAVQRSVMRHDALGEQERRDKAYARRGVTGRRLPHGMGQISAVVSDQDYHEIMHSLERAAKRQAAAAADAEQMCAGSPDHVATSLQYADRSLTQLIADEFVARLTGHKTTDPTNIAVHLVMSAETLLADGPDADEPADLVGPHGVCGPIPAAVARRMLTDAALAAQTPGAAAVKATIRRLFTFPGTGVLVAMESHSRTFDGELAGFLRLRDQTCRTPWCNGRVKHGDHITPAAAGGPTSALNGQGLCEACNYTKESPGWLHQPDPRSDLAEHFVDITTPTGHHYTSTAPPLPGRPPALSDPALSDPLPLTDPGSQSPGESRLRLHYVLAV